MDTTASTERFFDTNNRTSSSSEKGSLRSASARVRLECERRGEKKMILKSVSFIVWRRAARCHVSRFQFVAHRFRSLFRAIAPPLTHTLRAAVWLGAVRDLLIRNHVISWNYCDNFSISPFSWINWRVRAYCAISFSGFTCWFTPVMPSQSTMDEARPELKQRNDAVDLREIAQIYCVSSKINIDQGLSAHSEWNYSLISAELFDELERLLDEDEFRRPRYQSTAGGMSSSIQKYDFKRW